MPEVERKNEVVENLTKSVILRISFLIPLQLCQMLLKKLRPFNKL
jgi:hypothetical protein